MKNTPRTLVLLCNDKQQILLGMKKYGQGKGYWNGFGGKVESGETVIQGAIRELEEESGIVLQEKDLSLRAILHFNWIKIPEQNYDGVVYFGTYLGNDFRETEEMKPQWWNIDEIPYDKMWEDDKYWLPQVLEGKSIELFTDFSSETTLEQCKVVEKDYLFYGK